MNQRGVKQPVVSNHSLGPRSQRAYIVGFVTSVVLTLVAFGLVELYRGQHLDYSRTILIAGIITLAIVQFFVQVFCFLHLGRETRPRWKLLVFAFMLGTVLILVIGSLWIMTNLDYHMTQHQLDEYLKSQDGL